MTAPNRAPPAGDRAPALPLPGVHPRTAAERAHGVGGPAADREMVSVHLIVDGGAAAESEAEAGIANLAAETLVTGTRRLDGHAFAEATERLGIEIHGRFVVGPRPGRVPVPRQPASRPGSSCWPR